MTLNRFIAWTLSGSPREMQRMQHILERAGPPDVRAQLTLLEIWADPILCLLQAIVPGLEQIDDPREIAILADALEDAGERLCEPIRWLLEARKDLATENFFTTTDGYACLELASRRQSAQQKLVRALNRLKPQGWLIHRHDFTALYRVPPIFLRYHPDFEERGRMMSDIFPGNGEPRPADRL